jgi:hypothetical protein
MRNPIQAVKDEIDAPIRNANYIALAALAIALLALGIAIGGARSAH